MVTNTWPPPKRLWSERPLTKSEEDELPDLRQIILNLRGGALGANKFLNGAGQWVTQPNVSFANVCPEGKWFEDRYAELIRRVRM